MVVGLDNVSNEKAFEKKDELVQEKLMKQLFLFLFFRYF